MSILFIFIIVILVVVIVLIRMFSSDNFPWIQFYARGRESGFSLNEINLLRRVAIESSIKEPVSLFWSVKQLDRALKSMILKYRSGATHNINQATISKFFDFRKKIEFEQPKYKIGITTSRKLTVRQVIKITLPGVGTYTSSVVENLRKYFAIAYPSGPKLPLGVSWAGQKINIYFWRPDDAGYVFETRILNDFIDSKVPILHVAHSDNLVRSQKRGSVRVDVNKNAFLYSISDVANEIVEKSSGIKCMLLDISEDGAAILIGGKARAGIMVKVQTKLSGEDVVMCGVVRGINFNQNKNQSVLHLKANPPSFVMKNRILGFVYGLFLDD
ncbi:MAG: PilZ domain-containing protein [Spirochaetaceae bacterium]|nr:PilZ domain-containing protein [Spirochaetaceae bacterium]